MTRQVAARAIPGGNMGTTRRKFQIIRTGNALKHGVPLGDRVLKFGGKTGAFQTSDEGLAKEIDREFGPRGKFPGVTVVPVTVLTEPGHRYTFSVPSIPWKRGTGKAKWVPCGNGRYRLVMEDE